MKNVEATKSRETKQHNNTKNNDSGNIRANHEEKKWINKIISSVDSFSNFEFPWPRRNLTVCVAFIQVAVVPSTSAFGTSWSISAVNNRQLSASTYEVCVCASANAMKNHIDFYHSYTCNLYALDLLQKENRRNYTIQSVRKTRQDQTQKSVHSCNIYNGCSHPKLFQCKYTAKIIFKIMYTIFQALDR